MVLYILTIAVLNLCVGFGISLYLGRQYRTMIEVQELLDMDDSRESWDDTSDEADDTAPDDAASDDTASDDTASDDTASDDTAPDEKPIDEKSAEDDQAEKAAEPQREKSPAETSVEDFQDEVLQFEGQLVQASDGLRAGMEGQDAAPIKEILNSLRKDSYKYLADRKKKSDAFEELHQERSEFKELREALQAAVQQQDQQIESTLETADAFDSKAWSKDGRRRIIHETGKLLGTNDQLRDRLDEAMVEVARSEERLGDPDQVVRRDSLTELANRAGMEAALADWWKRDPYRARPLSAVMVDLDDFGRINEQYGRGVGDKILAAVAQLLRAENRGELSTLARIAGQKFFFLLPDADENTASDVAERVRQTLEESHFEYRKNEIEVSVSCGITRATSEDTSAALLARTEVTLQEAKRFGGNRTFLHEGKSPTPVVPPNLALKKKQITL